MSPFSHLSGWKGYVAYDNASTLCKVIAGQSLKEGNFGGQVKLMENIGGYNSVKGKPELGWPLAQQIGLCQVSLRQFHACLSYHFG